MLQFEQNSHLGSWMVLATLWFWVQKIGDSLCTFQCLDWDWDYPGLMETLSWRSQPVCVWFSDWLNWTQIDVSKSYMTFKSYYNWFCNPAFRSLNKGLFCLVVVQQLGVGTTNFDDMCHAFGERMSYDWSPQLPLPLNCDWTSWNIWKAYTKSCIELAWIEYNFCCYPSTFQKGHEFVFGSGTCGYH